MECLNTDLDRFLDPKERPNIPLSIKLSILLDVSAGLLYLHHQLEEPLVHRDLKPENILMTYEPKLLILESRNYLKTILIKLLFRQNGRTYHLLRVAMQLLESPSLVLASLWPCLLDSESVCKKACTKCCSSILVFFRLNRVLKC